MNESINSGISVAVESLKGSFKIILIWAVILGLVYWLMREKLIK